MRTFIAIEIPFFREIEELQKSIEGRAKLVEEENMHITLKFLGEIEEKLIEKIKKIVEECKVDKFKISLQGVGFFPNERYIRVIWIGIDGYEPIVKMAKCIDEKLSKLGFEREKGYVPHLTVARAKGRVSIMNYDRFKNLKFGEVDVREVKIKNSTLTPKGPIYEDVAVIQL
ncbi:2'-5' RNA ligase [Aciduliprofundum boonei T469]|uniref:RNA 2',3'-cyclic phosphodiesterase n=2 Tax=Candidatus Aciduliprofundum boonei TaxID=379547 RepID=D3TAK6_ACIB4|nr:2'-5' RNA ligase [Aciduliprofundum boonei T469]